jgi:hypothetical protein
MAGASRSASAEASDNLFAAAELLLCLAKPRQSLQFGGIILQWQNTFDAPSRFQPQFLLASNVGQELELGGGSRDLPFKRSSAGLVDDQLNAVRDWTRRKDRCATDSPATPKW